MLAWERWGGAGISEGHRDTWGETGVLLILMAGMVSRTCTHTKLSRSCTVRYTSVRPFAFLSQLLHRLAVSMWLCMLACFFLKKDLFIRGRERARTCEGERAGGRARACKHGGRGRSRRPRARARGGAGPRDPQGLSEGGRCSHGPPRRPSSFHVSSSGVRPGIVLKVEGSEMV